MVAGGRTIEAAAVEPTRRGRAFWDRLFEEVERGENVASLARRHRVKLSTLKWWCWRLRTESAGDQRLLPVVVRAAAPRFDEVPVQVVIGDIGVRVAVGTDVSYVAALVGALRRC